MTVSWNEYIGYSDSGEFFHSAGTNKISTTTGNNNSGLYLGYSQSVNGTYNLSGSAQLRSPDEFIGYSGIGTFNQSGGTNTIWWNSLILGSQSGSSGTYNLNGGTLMIKSLTKGSGTAAFNFGGGTLQASGSFSTSLPMTLTGIGGDAKVNTNNCNGSLFPASLPVSADWKNKV